jgi:acyl-CoA synthetase (AMP-forming)/AMP-acid ligase II
MRLYEVLGQSALNWGEREALITESKRLSYFQLEKYANRIARRLLSLGIEKGEKVAFMLPNSAEYVATFFALSAAGTIGVPLNTRLAPAEIRFILGHSDARACIFDQIYRDRIERIMNDPPSDILFIQSGGHIRKGVVALEQHLESARDVPPEVSPSEREVVIFYTSGTTGDPKGVILDTEKSIDFFMNSPTGNLYGLTPKDRIYLSTPLFHASGAFLVVKNTLLGVPCYVTREWKAENALKLIEKARITFMWAVPTMLALMRKHPEFRKFDLGTLRQMLIGGSQLSMDIIRDWKDAWPDLKINNGYAQTETTATGSALRDEFILEKPGSIGLPNPGVQMKIVDEGFNELPLGQIGEIAINSPANMIGYYKNPEQTGETLRGDWCLSGDTGYMDDEGFFYYTGRKKDMIIRGGENIFPDEIEAVVNRHPDILESAVIGVADPVMGQEVLAVVALKPGSRFEAEEIVSHCKQSLADYKVPKYVKLEPEIPKTSTLKINKKMLREKYSI